MIEPPYISLLPVDTHADIAVDLAAGPLDPTLKVSEAYVTWDAGDRPAFDLPKFGYPDAPLFPPVTSEGMRVQMSELIDAYGAETIVSGATGLPTLLAGAFWRFQLVEEAPEQIAGRFLERYSLALGGTDKPPLVVPQWDAAWSENVWRKVRQLRYQQFVFDPISSERIPVWGAFIAFTFDSKGQLAIISSSLFSIDLAKLPPFPGAPPADADILATIEHDLPSVVTTRQTERADPRAAAKAQELIIRVYPRKGPYTRIILPYVRPERNLPVWTLSDYDWAWQEPAEATNGDPTPVGTFRPAYQLYFADQFGFPWLGIVDADPDAVPRLLYAAPAAAEVTKPYVVMPTTDVAEQFYAAITVNTSQSLSDLIALIVEWTKPVELGANANGGDAASLQEVTSIVFDGPRFHEPDYTPAMAKDQEQYLGANILFHLQNLQALWSGWLDTANLQGWHMNPSIANPLQKIAVHLEASFGSPYCDPASGDLHFTKGVTNSIREPAFDAKVISHEFAHAVMHYYASQIFQPASYTDIACQAFDEGLAFYWACTMFGDPAWAEFAYPAPWQQRRNVASAPLAFAQIDFSGIFDDWAHAIGMWWARVLWELEMSIGTGNLRALLLKLLNGLSGLTPAAVNVSTSKQRIRAVFITVAGNLLSNTPGADINRVRGVLQQAELL